MAAKKPDVKIPVDWGKIIAKIIKSPTARQIGQPFKGTMPKSLRELEKVTSSARYMDLPSSRYPRVAPPKPVKPKKLGESLSTEKLIPEPAPRRPRKPKKDMSTPKRPKKGVSLVDKTGVKDKPRSLPTTKAEQREADKRANRALRQSGDSRKPDSKSTGNKKPVDVKGSIITPPSKATMRPAKPSRGSYEADADKVARKADAADMGRGQKPPKPKGEDANLTPRQRDAKRRKAESDKRESEKLGPSQEARLLRLEVHRAKTPKEKAIASKNLMDFLLKKNK